MSNDFETNANDTEANLFDGFEEEFTDEDFLDAPDPSSEIVLKYGLEEIKVPVEEGKTLSQYLSDAQESLQFRSLDTLAVRVDSQYVDMSIQPQPGQVLVISAQGDRKGN